MADDIERPSEIEGLVLFEDGVEQKFIARLTDEIDKQGRRVYIARLMPHLDDDGYAIYMRSFKLAVLPARSSVRFTLA